MPTNPIELQANSLEELKEKVAHAAESDVPEGTNYYQITATLLNKLLNGKLDAN